MQRMIDGIIPYRVILAMIAGFLLPWQTIWIIRPGMLGGVSWPLATIGLYASDTVLLAWAVIGAMWAWRTRRQRLLAAVAILALIMTANVAISIDPWLSAAGWIRLALFLLALAGLPYPSEIRRAFIGGFAVALLGHVALGFWQFFTLANPASTLLGLAAHNAWTLGDAVVESGGERWLRAYGGFPHPNVFGVALLVALVAAFQGTGDKGQVTNPGRSPHSIRSILVACYLLLVVSSLVLTFSRAALLGLIILLAVLAVRRATRSVAIVGGLVFAGALLVTWPFWANRVTSSGRLEARSMNERITALRDARTLFAAHPWLGVGLHAMPQSLIAAQTNRDSYTAQPVHDAPFLAVVELGFFGLILLLAALYFLFPRQLLPFTFHLLPLLPLFLFDHFFWSLATGPALLFVAMSAMGIDSEEAVR